MKINFAVIKLKSLIASVFAIVLSTVAAASVLGIQKADANAVKTAYITFDDGPSAVTEEILDILKEEKIKATFFVIGPSGNKTDERIARIAEEGHSIGLHTLSHDYDYIYASAENFLSDLEAERKWIYSVTGLEPAFFRFPGGSMNSTVAPWLMDEIKTEAEKRGFLWYDWNADAKDSLGSLLSSEEIAQNIMSSEAAGEKDVIILLHDSSTRTTAPEALRIIISEFRRMGYSFDKLGN